jgi:hypothetical protein
MTPTPYWREHAIFQGVGANIDSKTMDQDIEYDEVLCAIVLFDWTLESLDREMKDCSCDR